MFYGVGRQWRANKLMLVAVRERSGQPWPQPTSAQCEEELPWSKSGRDFVLDELYQSVANDITPVHDGPWSLARTARSSAPGHGPVPPELASDKITFLTIQNRSELPALGIGLTVANGSTGDAP